MICHITNLVAEKAIKMVDSQFCRSGISRDKKKKGLSDG